MPAGRTRTILLFLFAFLLILALTSLHPGTPHSIHPLFSYRAPPPESPPSRPAPTNAPHDPRLSRFSNIKIIHLPHRADRLEGMRQLSSSLALDFDYVNATDKASPEIERILRVTRDRSRRVSVMIQNAFLTGDAHEASPPTKTELFFALFPQDSTATADSWSLPGGPTTFGTAGDHLPITPDMLQALIDMKPLPWKISEGMVACWFSHYQVIREFAESGSDQPILILEDDVDAEYQLPVILPEVLKGLPEDWDLLYLGYCASTTENLNSALPRTSFQMWSLHASNGPLCTHAYAVSAKGARALIPFLRAEMFAYLIALDEAFLFLVHFKAIHAYSIYPSVVIQLEDETGSDIQSEGRQNEQSKEAQVQLWESAIGRIKTVARRRSTWG